VSAEVSEGFEEFFERVEPRLRHAFTSLYGPDVALDAAAEALAWAYQHWERVSRMEYPLAYLFRVGRSRTRRLRRRPWVIPERTLVLLPEYEPRLGSVLASLPSRQRVCVLLAHGYGWSHSEVASLLGIRTTTVSTHVTRGMDRLRAALEVYEHD
jgi:DNA-directed RNA polymerase specialized sigma24 family protein